jgi:hypothetical protein
LNELLLEWEERRDAGRPVSPEELCRNAPELLPELQKRIKALQSMDGMMQDDTDPHLLTPSTPTPKPVATASPHAAVSAVQPHKTFAGSFCLPGYEIIDEIGRGGMGIVYKARQISLNRLVAIKTFLPGEDVREDDLERFKREASSVALLQHPNIVQIFDNGDCDGRPYLAFEFVEGGTLEQKLEVRRWNPDEAAQLVELLARAVHYAHCRGVIHRDIKPANILFATLVGSAPAFSTPCGVPKIADFGLARCLQAGGPRLTKKGTVLGTPSYMAPEQAAGKSDAISPATDVHALGAMLYELLAGRPPFDADSVYETLRQVIRQPPEPLRQFDPAIPDELERICLRCLEKEPAKRYPSAEELAEELRRFREGTPASSGAAVGTSRRQLLAIGGGLALLAVAVCLFFFLRPGDAISQTQIRQKAAELRPVLLERLSESRLKNGWILCKVGPDANPATDIEVWGHSQALADIFLSPSLRNDQVKSWAPSLENPFGPGQMLESEGVKYGWRAFPSADYPSAPPALQTGLALAGALNRPGFLQGERKQRCEDHLATTQQVLNLYRPQSFKGGWNMFPGQKDPHQYSATVTGWALYFLLELKRGNLGWEESESKRDELLAQTVRWIDTAYDPSADLPGWREGRGDAVVDGLTLMMYALRLRAEAEAGHKMPPEMSEKILPHLQRCLTRDADYPSTSSPVWYSFRNYNGQEVSKQPAIIVGWYRWALATSVLWLNRADKERVPRRNADAVRRVIGHLVVTIGDPIVKDSLNGWTFVAADNLNGLSFIPNP